MIYYTKMIKILFLFKLLIVFGSMVKKKDSQIIASIKLLWENIPEIMVLSITPIPGFMTCALSISFLSNKFKFKVIDDIVSEFQIKNIIIGERFNGESSLYSDDIAVVVLSDPVDISPSVSVVCVDWKPSYSEQNGNLGMVKFNYSNQ